jgi:hypothetical protein
MKQQGDPSIWKSLAVAFGDGLAFGVGVKIAQSSARKRAENSQAEMPTSTVAAPAEPVEPIDLQVLSKVLAAIDARLTQSEAKIAADLKAVETRQVQQNSNSQAALEEIHASMMDRVTVVERSAHTVEARLAGAIQAAVEARMREFVDARAQGIEERLRQDITAAGDRTAKLLVETIDARLLGRIELLEGEVRDQAATIRSLRETADGSQKKLHEALEGIGRACQTAIDELKKPETSAEGGAAPTAVAAPAESDAAETDDRRFDSLKLVNPARPERKLPIPLVSSIALILLGMAALGSQAIGF